MTYRITVLTLVALTTVAVLSVSAEDLPGGPDFFTTFEPRNLSTAGREHRTTHTSRTDSYVRRNRRYDNTMLHRRSTNDHEQTGASSSSTNPSSDPSGTESSEKPHRLNFIENHQMTPSGKTTYPGNLWNHLKELDALELTDEEYENLIESMSNDPNKRPSAAGSSSSGQSGSGRLKRSARNVIASQTLARNTRRAYNGNLVEREPDSETQYVTKGVDELE